MSSRFTVLFLLAACLAPRVLFAQDKPARIDELMSRYHEYRQFNGSVLVADHDRVIFKKGYGLANMEWNIPNAPDTRFRLGSITKQFTAALIMQLVDEGKLRLDAKMSEYLPDYPKKTADLVTIHQLLNHTSGIPSYTGLPDFFEKISRDPYTPADFLKIFSGLNLEFEPGSKFRYNNSGYFLLGVIVEKLTGRTYEDALRERILKPLNLTGTGYDLHKTILNRRAAAYDSTLDGYRNAPYLDMSIPYSAGSLYSTVEDLFTWTEALHEGRVVSKHSRDLMYKPNLENYGYGLVIEQKAVPGGDRKITSIGHGGGINGFSTRLERVMEDGHVIVLLNNTGGTDLGEMTTAIKSILYTGACKLPRKPVASALYRIVIDQGVQAAVKQYREWKSGAPDEYQLAWRELDRLGRHLLELKRLADAIEILKLNAAENPTIPGVHESLGDAYRDNHQEDDAIRSYAKALQIEPADRDIAAKLTKLVEHK
jgi:CubicO group peptidase (beta-lactamase class C family)